MTQHSAAEILETMSDGFVALDRQWRYVYVNRAAEQFTGLCREDMLGRTQWELFPEIIGSQFELVCRRAISVGGLTSWGWAPSTANEPPPESNGSPWRLNAADSRPRCSEPLCVFVHPWAPTYDIA